MRSIANRGINIIRSRDFVSGSSVERTNSTENANYNVGVIVDMSDTIQLNNHVYARIKKYVTKLEAKSYNTNNLDSNIFYYPYNEGRMNNYKYNKKLSNDIDILKEYVLIQNKKSQLSKSERDAVVQQFEKEYIDISNMQ